MARSLYAATSELERAAKRQHEIDCLTDIREEP